MANDSLRYAGLGEVPDYGGSAFWAGPADSPSEIEKQFFIDLRTHYRKSSATLASSANFVLLISVVAGVLAGFTSNVVIASGLAVAWIAFVVFSLRVFGRRRVPIKKREVELETRRIEYNESIQSGITEAMGQEYTQIAFRPIEPFERMRW